MFDMCIYIYTYFERRLFENMLPLTFFLSFKVTFSNSSRMWTLPYSAASLKESLEEMGPFFEVGCKQTSTCLEQVIFVPVTGLLKTIGFWKRPFFCAVMLGLSYWTSQWSIQMDNIWTTSWYGFESRWTVLDEIFIQPRNLQHSNSNAVDYGFVPPNSCSMWDSFSLNTLVWRHI